MFHFWFPISALTHATDPYMNLIVQIVFMSIVEKFHRIIVIVKKKF